LKLRSRLKPPKLPSTRVRRQDRQEDGEQARTAAAATAPGSAGQAEIVYLVKVRSLPVGAQVLIDGEPMGQTPFQRRILDMDKSHTVTVRKPGFLPYESSVSPRVPGQKTATCKLLACSPS